ncbi:tRNA uridine-5-carboxymethylaminomethyl(34) synthesis GTPase MnmE [Candidatus Shikimatogenerans silvanidophilus]|uniref:tRNA uridine-5-carboxymethylaminomethyl(34) synthesis GTPase MnmE n=1 Tax=Candidatus Shikimatogenerans silvanidophilus TaxID=2782547 RepID=UPI001BA61A02|nr:tRNA uridine-5-carboxymethylaminomethyl(34) synthesis GTPase MnmE [Candidatus Shikimatogenerans silvanidophilus]
MINNEETIAAISTPYGIGAISIIKISGKKSKKIIEKIFKKKNKKKIIYKSHFLQVGYIYDKKDILDEVVIAFFKKPNSYTGEDVIEIYFHGSIYLQNKILKLCIENGSRIANPGEFTFRSFINGKKDLSQAESIADIISSKTKKEHKLAINYMNGNFSKKIKKIQLKLINFLSLIEFNLDHSENENISFIKLKKILDNIIYKLKIIIDSFNIGNIIKNGIKVVFIGDTNVGKSTLFNSIINENKSIVSNEKGTTRDVIEKSIIINDIMYILFDTAGIRKTNNKIEKIGIKKTYDVIKESQIIIYVFDSSKFNEKKIKNDIFYFKKKYPKKKIILLGNKSDICNIKNKYNFENYISISYKCNKNIFLLKKMLINIINIPSFLKKNNNIVLFHHRHFNILKKTLFILNKINKNLIKKNKFLELISIDLKNSISYIKNITGENISSDEILKNIFSKFCIGK